jgi:hypothetical protein
MSTQAYTPGLKRKESYLVRRTRKLPVPGEVLVKARDRVSQDTVIARASVPGQPVACNVAYAIGIDPKEIKQWMPKKIGDSVKEKESLANYEAFFGMIKRQCLSPCNGTIEHISEVTGQVIIREPPTEIELKAYVPGIVAQTFPSDGAVVETPAAFIQGIFGIGGETYGELMLLSTSPSEKVSSSQIDENCRGRVLVCGAQVDAETLRKAREVGARAIVVGGIDESDLEKFCGYEIGVAITGQEKVGLTLVLTEAFGAMSMLENTFTILQKFNGKLACLNGATQIRAGVIRPEVIIPLEISTCDMRRSEEDDAARSQGLDIGNLVRVIREPHFGALGRIVSLPAQLQKLETESEVRVLQVELPDRRRAVVPRANVEIIEE